MVYKISRSKRFIACSGLALHYLHQRGIDDELIDFCIQTGRLYESYPYLPTESVSRGAL